MSMSIIFEQHEMIWTICRTFGHIAECQWLNLQSEIARYKERELIFWVAEVSIGVHQYKEEGMSHKQSSMMKGSVYRFIRCQEHGVSKNMTKGLII